MKRRWWVMNNLNAVSDRSTKLSSVYNKMWWSSKTNQCFSVVIIKSLSSFQFILCWERIWLIQPKRLHLIIICSSCTTNNYVELFLKYLSLCLFQSDSHTSFLRAARAGNIDKVLEFLKGGVDIGTSNQVRDTSLTVIHYTPTHTWRNMDKMFQKHLIFWWKCGEMLENEPNRKYNTLYLNYNWLGSIRCFIICPPLSVY